MIIPKNVKVGNFVYTVEVTEDPILLDYQVCSGICDNHNQLIQIDAGLTEQNKERVFLHELIHAMCMDKELHFGDETEHVVDNLAKSLHGIILDNPILFMDGEVLDEILNDLAEEVEDELEMKECSCKECKCENK